jgi:hypothetical protein
MKGKNKDEILEEIKVLKENNPSEFKELRTEIGHLSTDEESDRSIEDSFSQKEKLSKDVYEVFSDSKFLDALRDKDFTYVASLLKYNLNADASYNQMLKDISYSIKNIDISKDIKTNIFITATDELMLLGEDVTEIMQHYYSD